MMKHTFEEFIFIYVNVLIFVITTFDFWMRKGALDTFVLVISFLTLHREPKHVIIGLFEVKGVTRIILASKLQTLFEKYKLIEKIFVM
jgi:hypothetical protein